MERDSISAGSLLSLGIILIILGGSSPGQDIEPVGMGTLRLYIFMIGIVLLIVGFVLVLRARRHH